MSDLARELGWSIRQVEDLDGQELEEWKAHFRRKPFTVDLIDMACAHIAQAVVQSASGKRSSLERHLLIKRESKDDKARRSGPMSPGAGL